MTEKLEEILNTKKLPKDELDNIWDNLFGFLPTAMFLIASVFSFFGKQTDQSMKLTFKLLFLFITQSLFLYTLWAKMTERQLKSIKTNLSTQQNLLLIDTIAKKNNWSTKTDKQKYKEYMIPFVFGQNGHKLTLIILDNEILYNLRNIGSSKGRMPYLFGIDTAKEIKLRGQIKNYA